MKSVKFNVSAWLTCHWTQKPAQYYSIFANDILKCNFLNDNLCILIWNKLRLVLGILLYNDPVPYPTMHHFVTEMCTCVHISATKWCTVGYLSNVLWDLWHGSIGCQPDEPLASLVTTNTIINVYGSLVVIMLTHWGRDKMTAVSQTTLSNAFSWLKMLEFRLRFHWSLFLRVQLTIIQHWFR